MGQAQCRGHRAAFAKTPRRMALYPYQRVFFHSSESQRCGMKVLAWLLLSRVSDKDILRELRSQPQPDPYGNYLIPGLCCMAISLKLNLLLETV